MKSNPVLRGVLGVACAALLCSSSCHVHYSSGVHNDCDNRSGSNDGCGGDTGGAQDDGGRGWDLGSWVIREHGGIERAPEPERHPVRRVVDVIGVALPPEWPKDSQGFVHAGALIIEANPELLGLPTWAGELVAVSVARDGALIWVRFAQVWRLETGLLGAPGGGAVAFGFDDLGRLIELTNTTLVYPWR